MLYASLKALHILSIIVWVGGMAFAHFFLRPALAELEAPARVVLMRDVLGRFFTNVLSMIVIALVTGIWMMSIFLGQATQAGTEVKMPLGWMFMGAVGLLMMAIFGHIRFVLFRRLHAAVLETKWTVGAAALASIRSWVRLNLGLGILVVIAASGVISY